jgi:hypothetical protein
MGEWEVLVSKLSQPTLKLACGLAALGTAGPANQVFVGLRKEQNK